MDYEKEKYKGGKSIMESYRELKIQKLKKSSNRNKA